MGGGLPGKTLQTYEPHFCRNLDGLRDNGLLAILSANTEYLNTECSCLVICVRSIHSGDIDYALEFIWAKNRNYLILLESLLLTLKSCLPSFTFASGAQLGDELRVIDVENSTGSGIGFINILQGNGLSPIPKALQEERKSVAEDYISSSQVKLNQVKESVCTLKRKSNVLGNSELQESNFVKRKLNKLNNNTNFWVVINPIEEDSKANQEPSASSRCVSCPGNDGLIIKVEYGDHRMLSYLPMSSKLADIKKYIDEKYTLSPGNYKLHFFADEWLRLVVEQDWETCIFNRRVTKTQTIRLRVQPFTNLMVNGMYQ